MEAEKQVVILLYDGVEILDVAGPAEVFSAARTYAAQAYTIGSVAASLEPVSTANGLKLSPNYTFSTCPKPDILLIPGGNTEEALADHSLLLGMQALILRANLILTVCTGSLLLAQTGLLAGKSATTYHTALKKLKKMAPTCNVIANKRFVDCGRIVSTAGVSAGIDGALHVVQRQQGRQAAVAVARYMEYNHWRETDGLTYSYTL